MNMDTTNNIMPRMKRINLLLPAITVEKMQVYKKKEKLRCQEEVLISLLEDTVTDQEVDDAKKQGIIRS